VTRPGVSRGIVLSKTASVTPGSSTANGAWSANVSP
jgi:hypothetical protein